MQMTFKEMIRRSAVLEESHELTIRLQWVSGVAEHFSSRCSMILNLLSRDPSACFYLTTPPLHGEGSNSIDKRRQTSKNSQNSPGSHSETRSTRSTHLTMCLCLSTQYLIALLTNISCFFVKPFGPTPPLKVIPAVGRKVAVKSCRLLYILRRSRSSMLSLWGGIGGGALSDSRIWSALPACMQWEESLLIVLLTWIFLNVSISWLYLTLLTEHIRVCFNAIFIF